MTEYPDKPAYGPKHHFPAKISFRRNLSGQNSDKETLHLGVDLSSNGPIYATGDVLALYPRNTPVRISQLLESQHLSGEESVLPQRCDNVMPLYEALSAKLNFHTRPTNALIKTLAESTASSTERAQLQLLLNAPADVLADYIAQREIPDVLAEYPQTKLSAQQLTQVLPPLNPRMYSIASSPLLHPNVAHLAVAMAYHPSSHGPCKGVTSAFLSEMVELNVTTVPIFISKGSMHLPVDERDILMLGPGTGIAPFRGFLQERELRGAKGRNWLFFGNRSESNDFYFRDEIEALQKSGLLTKLSLAWSRNGADKRYVQDELWDNRDEVWNWLENGATLYICGKKDPMAKDVESSLCRIAANKIHFTDNSPESAEWLKNMKREKRIQTDVY